MSALSKDRLFELRNQIMMAETINKEELQPIMIEAVERYTGKFVPRYGYNWDIILNEVYPIIQTHLPSTFFKNPRAFLKPRQKTFIAKVLNPATGKKEPVEMDSQKSANTQEGILNYDIYRMKYKNETRKTLLDALLFPHAVLWHGYKGDFGMTEEQNIFIENDNVFVTRINPMRFIKDPCVNMANVEEGRWVGRIIDIPYMDFMEDDKLDIDKKLVKGFKGYGEKVGTFSSLEKTRANGKDTESILTFKNLLDYTDAEFKKSKYAKFVRCYEIFLRPTKKEKRAGKKGYILLLTAQQEKPLRENDWTIKAKGFPSKILQFNDLNDSMFGMSDIDTYKSIADQKNIITNLQIRNAQENSKLYVAIAKAGIEGEEDIEKIQKGDQTIIMFPGDNIQNRMSVQSGGGAASSELYLVDQRIQKNLDEKSGVNDLRRGVLQSGEESAFSVKQRAAASSARPAYRQDKMADFLKESFTYINQLHKQFIPFTEAVRIIGSLDLQWTDKPTEEEIQADVDVEIDAISMLPENPQDELQQLQVVLQTMMMALQSPQLAEKIRQEGKTFNVAPVIEQMLMRMKIKDPEIFRSIRPDENQGFVSVEQLREAKQNVNAAIAGQPIQFPPKITDDHVAKLEIYTTIQQLLQAAGQVSDMLEQLIQVHTALLEELMSKEATPGMKPDVKKPTNITI